MDIEIVKFRTAELSPDEMLRLEIRAQELAAEYGISEKEWSAWRRGDEVKRDLLMFLDPMGEVERIDRV